MKHIYLILFTAALSASVLSCKDNTSSEPAKDHIEETGEKIKHAADSAGAAIKEESKKTTKNGDDAH